ncbi:P-loop containing nucleoside triphosphate hydrolase protein [Cyathus striatus]|nr:P-loop containing nucleoside triphosphate hydrolase protein [Cyathus striatus]
MLMKSQWHWSFNDVRALAQYKLQISLCWTQIKIAIALYTGKDVVACLATGAGKTLTFWIPLLMAVEDKLDKMSFVVTPLNLLGKQNVSLLEKVGIEGISISRESVNSKTIKEIENGKYKVMLKKEHVTQRLLNIIIDEGHCISQWASFRKQYLNLGALCYRIPTHIPFYVPSATLPKAILKDVDLSFLIPKDLHEGSEPPKFLVFFDSTKETESACKYLRMLIPRSLHMKIQYFHLTMSTTFREHHLEELKKANLWGLCCTDAFGMVSESPR